MCYDHQRARTVLGPPDMSLDRREKSFLVGLGKPKVKDVEAHIDNRASRRGGGGGGQGTCRRGYRGAIVRPNMKAEISNTWVFQDFVRLNERIDASGNHTPLDALLMLWTVDLLRQE